MLGREIDQALRELDALQESLAQMRPKNERERAAIERACAQTTRIAEQLRTMRADGPSGPTDSAD